MTEAEKKEIVALVMSEISGQAVDFDLRTVTPQRTDILPAVRPDGAGGYTGVTLDWGGITDELTTQATQAKNDAETAKNTANTILTQVQNKGTEITNFVATSKTEIEAQKDESVNAVKSVYQTDLNELKGDLGELVAENNNLKVEVARNRRQIENLNDRLDGDLIENKYKMTGETPDDAGVLSLPPSKLLPFAEVDEVHGRTEAYSELDLGSRNDWIYGNYIASAWAISLDAKAILSAENYTFQTWGNIDVGTFAYEPTDKVLVVNTGSSTVKPSGMLRYDGTSNTLHDAVNVKVKSVGANILETRRPSVTINGITFTKNVDGSITAKGTAAITTAYQINTVIGSDTNHWSYSDALALSGVHYFSIFASKSNEGVSLNVSSVDTINRRSYLNGCTINAVKSDTFTDKYRYVFSIWVKAGTTIDDTYYPMVCKRDIKKWVPYSSHTLDIPVDWYTKAEALGYDLGMEGTVIDMVGKKVTWGKRIEGLGIVDITPITKTFAELGFEPIDNGLPVESNGTITVISEGTQAEAMIHYAIDNRSTT